MSEVVVPARPRSGRRRRALAATALVVLAGLLLRLWGPGVGLPFAVTKVGGSVLWGAMVYGIAAASRPAARPGRLAAGAFAFAVLVELFRLAHAPWLDAFRFTLAGALLLGRIFSPWNVLFYALGIAMARRWDRPW
nr:DUF2809 domain-containing protein [Lichenibacterium minor]